MILRRLGNKQAIAQDIIKYFPAHKIYVEPFFGAGGMFFQKPKAKFNMVNDIDKDVFCLFTTILNEKEQLENLGLYQYLPTEGTQGTDGRRIFIEWNFENPKLGSSIDVTVLYEELQTNETMVLLGVLGVVLILAFIFVKSRKTSYDIIMPVLTRDERKVMEMILASDKKEINQNDVVRELDASKAKVSRIIKNLEIRGLIEIKHIGRKNKIKLVENPQITK